ncbi:MAG: alpha/beta hydrolase, partial [Bergeyella zoohelcum]|nr:alpha/beta hydrolase [Bergeyella zoohelcum]
EAFHSYVQRMADRVDATEPFALLGYSFGGIIVQEIALLKKPEKIVILGSIKSDKEKSKLIKIAEKTGLPRLFLKSWFNDKGAMFYAFIRQLFDPKNPKIMDYFRVRNPYYLKWSIEKIAAWKFAELPNVVQILGDKDIVFPIKNSKPDYIIKGGTHLFPVTKHKAVSEILIDIFNEKPTSQQSQEMGKNTNDEKNFAKDKAFF